MTGEINLSRLNALADRVAESVSSIISEVQFDTPRFNNESGNTNATNSLDKNYLADLIASEHLKSSRLDSYYSDIANA